VASGISLRSPEGGTEVAVQWRLVELWKVPAEILLATADPGLMPWAPLTRFAGPPEPVVRRCREIIDRSARGTERANLLAVAQVLTRLRYNDPQLLGILGGHHAMIESPLLDQLRDESRAEGASGVLLAVLRSRFGVVPEDLADQLRDRRLAERSEELSNAAMDSPDLAAFRQRLSKVLSETPDRWAPRRSARKGKA
jgi:hypothetical protein